MASLPSPKTRRLRWALFIALALHLVLLWRYAPALFKGAESAVRLQVAKPVEEIVQIIPPPAPPKKRGMVLATKLGSISPEALQAPLPEGFFTKPKPLAGGTLQLAGGLDFSRATGLQIVANIVPAAVRLPGVNALDTKPRTPRPATVAKPESTETLAVQAATAGSPVLPLESAGAYGVLTQAPPEPVSEPMEVNDSPVPFLAPPPPAYDVDAAIQRAAAVAEQSVRAASAASQSRLNPDYRAMLPQGPVVAAPPLPLGGNRALRGGATAATGEGITTYALEAQPLATNSRAPSAAQTKAAAVAQQQFFAVLTARLKATNQRVLAEAIKAGPKATVQMQFAVNREGRILDMRATDRSDRYLVERAMATLRLAQLPPVPAVMTQVPVELSFPVEVYR